MATTSIEDMPQEILLEVVKCIQYLPGAFNYRNTLYSLCLVKHFSSAATELLYEYGPTYPKPCLFLRKILQKPLLAALVRTLDLEPSEFKHYEAEMTTSDMAIFVSSIKALRLQDSDREAEWIRLVRLETPGDALSTLLLLYTPNVTSVSASESEDLFLFANSETHVLLGSTACNRGSSTNCADLPQIQRGFHFGTLHRPSLGCSCHEITGY
jgi:hypothetical protein